MKVAIIGGGLAGCAAAYTLKKNGHEPVIYDAGDRLASGASGNSIGLYNPRFGAEWSVQSQYYAAAFERALEVFPLFDDIDFNPCGALHLMNDDKKVTRFHKMIEAWPWGQEMMRIVGAREASDIAGIEIETDALFLARSGSVNPAKLCLAYTNGVDVHLNHPVSNSDEVHADAIILAIGAGAKDFDEVRDLDLRSVRGQVSLLEANQASAKMNCHICYGGYISKAVDAIHMLGATFQRWLDHREITQEDDAENLDKLYMAIPSFSRDGRLAGSWAAVRCASRDHFPVVGRLSDRVYISAAHGSHGILSSLMSAEIICNMIDNKPQPLSADTLSALCPSRFKG